MKKIPTIGEYGNFQGEPFSTDYNIDYKLLLDYIKKDKKYPFFYYLNMSIDELEILDDRIKRKVLNNPEKIKEIPPEKINKDLEKDSNLAMNKQAFREKTLSLEQKKNLYDKLSNFENEIEIMKKYISKI